VVITGRSLAEIFDAPRGGEPAVWSRYEEFGYWDDTQVGWALSRAAAQWPDRIALVIGSSRLTFAELDHWARQVAEVFASSGIGAGDRVIVQLPNSPEIPITVFAAWLIGAIPVPVIPMYRPHELAAIVTQTHPSAFVSLPTRGSRQHTDEADEALRAARLDKVARFSVGAKVPGWSLFPPRDSPSEPLRQPTPRPADSCALILFTSGTTQAPKGVRHNSRSLIAEVATYRDGARLGADDVVFIPAPIAHIGAVVATTILPCLVGLKVVVMPEWDATRAVETVAAEQATFAIGAPIFLSSLLDSYETASPDLHRIRKFHTGAAPAAAEVVLRAGKMGVLAWRAWGMTEAPTLTYGSPGDPLERRANTDGKIEAGTEVEAVDPERRPLPTGSVGELRLRSPKQMLGYIVAEQTSEQVDADGWIYSGDLGWVDEQGWVTVTGRIKDIINRGGEKFSALEIERAISSHPAIAEAAVVGLPDERLGEVVGAFVTVAQGAEFPGDAALIAHLENAALARQKFPVTWTVLAELPITATGKVQKRLLLDS